ncbi:sugar ABC transporter ATP-binding protein [Candidatus Aerophobetes bacterium Ae_b3b]|nr:MAG: sugar ABC transporter ATP-binding protein [Candidatus Aerophobetes bacterium Ae_b3b]
MKIAFKHLSKYFGKVKAVDNLNLEVGDGEFVALLGPSGCGKTTILLMIAGIYKPTKGLIYFDQRVVNNVLPKDRKIGMVFQSYALYPHMAVFDNIAYPLKLKKVHRKETKERVQRVADMMGIGELLDRKPAQLSGGQQQRVALARALIKEPEILLLDEPLSNLDARLRIMMRSELKRLQKDLGITTVFVTHDQLEALTMADRVAVVNLGCFQQFSTPDELYNHPKNLFVAGFIGSPPINFINVSLEKSDGRFLLKSRDLEIPLPKELGSKAGNNSTSSEVVLGIRPEHILINEKEGIDTEIYVVEPLGREILVSAKLGDSMIKVLTSPPFKANMGDRVRLSFNLDKIMLFDKKTEKSLLLDKD